MEMVDGLRRSLRRALGNFPHIFLRYTAILIVTLRYVQSGPTHAPIPLFCYFCYGGLPHYTWLLIATFAHCSALFTHHAHVGYAPHGTPHTFTARGHFTHACSRFLCTAAHAHYHLPTHHHFLHPFVPVLGIRPATIPAPRLHGLHTHCTTPHHAHVGSPEDGWLDRTLPAHVCCG